MPRGYKKVPFAREYSVSRNGKILKNGKPQKLTLQNGYYYFVMPRRYHPKGKQLKIAVHRLVAFVWANRANEIFNSSLQVHHRNNNKLDNRASNLVIVTQNEHTVYHKIQREFMEYAVNTKRYQQFEKIRLENYRAIGKI